MRWLLLSGLLRNSDGVSGMLRMVEVLMMWLLLLRRKIHGVKMWRLLSD